MPPSRKAWRSCRGGRGWKARGWQSWAWHRRAPPGDGACLGWIQCSPRAGSSPLSSLRLPGLGRSRCTRRLGQAGRAALQGPHWGVLPWGGRRELGLRMAPLSARWAVLRPATPR